jgi:3-dehydroquinate dehydratase/shikimate dehydrogenase
MSQLKPFLVKLACTPRSTAELLALAQIRTPGLKAVTAMGEFAEPLRALYGRLGSFMTYAAFGHDVATAPGQMSLKEMREVYRAHEVDETWAAFAVVGNPVRHSKGPHLWNHAFRALGMRAVYCRIPLDDADLLPEVIRTFALSGVSVTVPHKSAVMRHMAELDETAERIGAVNTVAAREGKLRGTNTDWIGAVGAIEEGCRRKFGSGTLGKKALVFGAGGTGRAVVYGLAEAGAEVILTNRDWDRASDVAQEFGVKVVPIEAVEEVVDPEIVVNATSVGMAPDADRSVVPPSLLRPDQVCMDVVYAPRETRFLREAAEAGAECVPGERMFILQAAAQFRELTGREVPAEVQEAWTRMVQE